MSVIPVLNMYVNSVSLSRPDVLKSGIGPTAEILSFASPKESIQRKGDPDSALILRFYENHPWFSPCGPAYRLFKFAPGKFVAFDEGFRMAIPGPAKTSGLLPLPYRAHFAKSCDARGGITVDNPFARLKVV